MLTNAILSIEINMLHSYPLVTMRLINLLRTVILYSTKLSIRKTVWANFKLLPFNQAVKFPIFIFKKTQIAVKSGGRVHLYCKPKPGLLYIGGLDIHWIPRGSRNYVLIDGTINLYGQARFGYQTKIIVGTNAVLSLGGDNVVNHDSSVMVHDKVTIGYGAEVGWNVQICDTDFHYVMIDNVVSRKTKPITIGKEAWVGSHCNIGKGAYLPDYSVLSSCSLLNKDYSDSGSNLFIAGVPGKIIKDDVSRIMEFVHPQLCQNIDMYFLQHPEKKTVKVDTFIQQR